MFIGFNHFLNNLGKFMGFKPNHSAILLLPFIHLVIYDVFMKDNSYPILLWLYCMHAYFSISNFIGMYVCWADGVACQCQHNTTVHARTTPSWRSASTMPPHLFTGILVTRQLAVLGNANQRAITAPVKSVANNSWHEVRSGKFKVGREHNLSTVFHNNVVI